MNMLHKRAAAKSVGDERSPLSRSRSAVEVCGDRRSPPKKNSFTNYRNLPDDIRPLTSFDHMTSFGDDDPIEGDERVRNDDDPAINIEADVFNSPGSSLLPGIPLKASRSKTIGISRDTRHTATQRPAISLAMAKQLSCCKKEFMVIFAGVLVVLVIICTVTFTTHRSQVLEQSVFNGDDDSDSGDYRQKFKEPIHYKQIEQNNLTDAGGNNTTHFEATKNETAESFQSSVSENRILDIKNVTAPTTRTIWCEITNEDVVSTNGTKAIAGLNELCNVIVVCCVNVFNNGTINDEVAVIRSLENIKLPKYIKLSFIASHTGDVFSWMQSSARLHFVIDKLSSKIEQYVQLLKGIVIQIDARTLSSHLFRDLVFRLYGPLKQSVLPSRNYNAVVIVVPSFPQQACVHNTEAIPRTLFVRSAPVLPNSSLFCRADFAVIDRLIRLHDAYECTRALSPFLVTISLALDVFNASSSLMALGSNGVFVKSVSRRYVCQGNKVKSSWSSCDIWTNSSNLEWISGLSRSLNRRPSFFGRSVGLYVTDSLKDDIEGSCASQTFPTLRALKSMLIN